MPIFRPSNINKRLVGTTSILTEGSNAGSPGNGGQVGPTKTPYCIKGVQCSTLCLGQRYYGGGGACGGVFKVNESACGVRENCETPGVDCGGIFICCGPGTEKWFVAPSSVEVCRTWYSRGDASTLATACIGSCSWFIPSRAQLIDPGSACKIYWDCYQPSRYWSDTQKPQGPYQQSARHAHDVSIVLGNSPPHNREKSVVQPLRAFRQVAT
jgi:hypothetical protein